MPYIPKDDRHALITERESENPGELTYLLTLAIFEAEREGTKIAYNEGKGVIAGYLRNKPERFATFAEVLGAISAAEMEYYRRRGVNRQGNFQPTAFLGTLRSWFYYEHVAPYEDEKIIENGDCF